MNDNQQIGGSNKRSRNIKRQYEKNRCIEIEELSVPDIKQIESIYNVNINRFNDDLYQENTKMLNPVNHPENKLYWRKDKFIFESKEGKYTLTAIPIFEFDDYRNRIYMSWMKSIFCLRLILKVR